ncbi:hypothetical protein [Labrenzia sp. OB1]|uniref:hypothetical protein n=1 Tax=Labrenzia sp. OB1 TaxID=1561204 RepID=UPI000837AEF0|nr:hypothetical protein [Labrenzia sp. OB1]
MRLADPTLELYSVALSSSAPSPEVRETDVTAEDVRAMTQYLRKARDRAIDIRDRSPAGSYLESVLTRTIDSLTLELSQLDYLLTSKPVNVVTHARRMRPAI